jgi:ABC-type uncharacterized transport system substrate-binding protein
MTRAARWRGGGTPAAWANELAMSKWLRIVAVLLAALVCTGDGFAHPHTWIDLRTRVIMNNQGYVSALELDWLFDDFYTNLIAKEFVKQNRSVFEFLTEMANTTLANIASDDYFTDIRLNGKRLPLGEAKQSELGLRNKRFWLRFEVPLREPVDPHSARLTFAVYDPTYSIEILYAKGASIIFSGPGGGSCFGRIVPPRPSVAAVAHASALDRAQSARDGHGLGELLAETVVVECS